MSLFGNLRIVWEMIKFEHTLFALPFALLGAFLAARGLPTSYQLAWIVAAMVGARSAAMAFNRLVDWKFDAANPRTQNRALPQGLVTPRYVLFFIVVSAGLFVFASYKLNRLAFLLSPVALAIVLLYSYTKRFTSLTHLFLGLALSGAPLGAWIAVRGELSVVPLFLGLAVALWVAGFDIIYACQDVPFDREAGLYSLPKRLGIGAALTLSSLMHAATVLLFGYVVYLSRLGWISYFGIFAVALLLAYEHSIVRPNDLSRVNTAFFTVNGCISILLFIVITLDILIGSRLPRFN